MRSHGFKLLAASLALAWTTSAWAIEIDGTVDAEYGAALSIQNTNTQFGDNNLGDLIATANGGSELDQVFAKVVGDRLYFIATGNMEKNFNKLDIYIDSVAGGANTIVGANVVDQVDGYCCSSNSPGDGALQRADGLTFDAGFAPDYFVTISHGNEDLNGLGFWAMSAHWADLSKGQGDATGRVSAGMQLGPQGKPVVLRFPFDADFNNDAIADGADLLIWQRNSGTTSGATRTTGDATNPSDGIVDGTDLAQWVADFGQTRSLTDGPFAPGDTTPPTTALIGPTLPNLGQGELIDKAYVAAHGGDGLGGFIAPELEFATESVRDMLNSVDLRMAINNSNTAGVSGDSGPNFDYTTATTENPGAVLTGIEFSIPLSMIGSPTGNIRITAFINGTGHDYAANQFAGDGILRGNLGGDGTGGYIGTLGGINLANLAGNQFVTVANPPALAAGAAAPEPAAGVLGIIALAGLAARSRRR